MKLSISVITVCKNNVTQIDKCLKSVTGQSYSNIEHVIIDGGSTDGTMGVIWKYYSKQNKIISEPDGGIYDAMNKGLKFASGDIICFLNADDHYVDDSVVGDIVTYFFNNDHDIVLADVEYFKSRRPTKVVRKYPAHRFKKSRLKFGWMPPHPGFFARRSVYEKFGFFDTNYKIAGDFDFIARVFQDDDIRYAYFSEPVVKMSVGGVSNSGLASKFLLNKEVLRSCRKNGIKTNWLFLMMKYPLKIWDVLRVKIF